MNMLSNRATILTYLASNAMANRRSLTEDITKSLPRAARFEKENWIARIAIQTEPVGGRLLGCLFGNFIRDLRGKGIVVTGIDAE
jgi:hypothetical protein